MGMIECLFGLGGKMIVGVKFLGLLLLLMFGCRG